MTPFKNQHIKMVGKKNPEIFTRGGGVLQRGAYSNNLYKIVCQDSIQGQFLRLFNFCFNKKKETKKNKKKAHETKCQ